jgi:DNA-binding response OmpR family regulator
MMIVRVVSAAIRILIIDDDAELCQLIADYLGPMGFQVTSEHDGIHGAERALAEPWHAIILDVMMPGCDGFEVLRRIRAKTKVPVMMLTGRGEEVDRIVGLEMGADDYLVKPFAAPELVARLKALVRRSNPRPVDLQLGGLQLDPFARRATIDGLTIELSAREWAVLEYLMQHASRVVSKQQIIDAILPWGEEVTLNAVEVYISRIRAKIDKAGISIKTIRGFGYMLEQSAL